MPEKVRGTALGVKRREALLLTVSTCQRSLDRIQKERSLKRANAEAFAYHGQMLGNPVRIGDGSATVTGDELPMPLVNNREGGSKDSARSQDNHLAMLVEVPLGSNPAAPTSPPREG